MTSHVRHCFPQNSHLTLLYSGRPKLYTVLAFPGAVGLRIFLNLNIHCDRFLELSLQVFKSATLILRSLTVCSNQAIPIFRSFIVIVKIFTDEGKEDDDDMGDDDNEDDDADTDAVDSEEEEQEAQHLPIPRLGSKQPSMKRMGTSVGSTKGNTFTDIRALETVGL